jgi:RimJ/RimL family protein N-acetyltransferase
MNLQPTHLQSDSIQLLPLVQSDFDALYQVANDPLLWEQHPNNDRYKIDVFTALFEGAMASESAFKIIDKATGQVAGSSRYYNYVPENKEIAIGYTFIDRQFWATDFNRKLKELMINYAFEYVDRVLFHVGTTNFRSQKAVLKLGANLLGEVNLNGKISFEYLIEQSNWNPIFYKN